MRRVECKVYVCTAFLFIRISKKKFAIFICACCTIMYILKCIHLSSLDILVQALDEDSAFQHVEWIYL